MKNYIFTFVLFITYFITFSNHIHSQEEYQTVPVFVEEVSEQTVYTFVDQKNLTDENSNAFAQRMANLYNFVDKITFDPSNRNFSIYFISKPSEEEEKLLLNLFKVFSYTLN